MTPPASLGTEATEPRLGARAEERTEGADPCVTFTLAALPSSVGRARRLTRDRLSSLAVGDDACDTAALVVSELVTNAIVHTASRTVVCEIRTEADTVRIAIRDEGCGSGVPRPTGLRGPDEEHGRGLLLVSAVSNAWGVQQSGTGLSVWAELPMSPPTDQFGGDLDSLAFDTGTDLLGTGPLGSDPRVSDPLGADRLGTDRLGTEHRGSGTDRLGGGHSGRRPGQGTQQRRTASAPAGAAPPAATAEA
ncbi:ATP-binding protein [Streptomyces longispororuber]|uniref:ATP-binding protein n=1 Tax=Streptomyces longispororuber TaxID=68230 RepID=UPI001E48CB5A|nr:ATP-binding protein [Streptomyces longispororuber]